MRVPSVDSTDHITSSTGDFGVGGGEIWDGQSESVGRSSDESVGLSLGPGSMTGTSTGDGVRWDGSDLPTDVTGRGSLLPDDNLTRGQWDCGLEGEGNRLGVGGLKDLGWVSTASTGDGSGWEESFGSLDSVSSVVRVITSGSLDTPDGDTGDGSLWSDWRGVSGDVELDDVGGEGSGAPSAHSVCSGGRGHVGVSPGGSTSSTSSVSTASNGEVRWEGSTSNWSTDDHSVLVVRVGDGTFLFPSELGGDSRSTVDPFGSGDTVHVEFSSSGVVVLGSGGGRVEVWDSRVGRSTHDVVSLDDIVKCIDITGRNLKHVHHILVSTEHQSHWLMGTSVSGTKESTRLIVHWESGQTSSTSGFGSETWEILGSDSTVSSLSSWNKDGFTTSGTSSSTDFTDEETHSAEEDKIFVESISIGEEGKMVIGIEETVTSTVLRGVDPAFDTRSGTLNDDLNLISTGRGPEWSHSKGEDGDVLLFWSRGGSDMELDTSVDNRSTGVLTFVGFGSSDRSIGGERITDSDTGSSISDDVSSGKLNVVMEESLDGWSAGSGRSDLEEDIHEFLSGRSESTSTSEGSQVGGHVHDVGKDVLGDGLNRTRIGGLGQRMNWSVDT